MPLRKRWFPVTHDINADPQIWELRDLYGDRALLIWLEMLSIADRNDGLIGPDSDQTRNQLASKCRSSRVKVGLVLDWCRSKVWIQSDNGLRIANFLKYHRTPEHKPEPNQENIRSSPIRSDPDQTFIREEEKIKTRASARKQSYPLGFEVSQEITEWAIKESLPDPITLLDAFRDYHVAHGSVFKDWNAALRTWVRNAKRFGNGNGRSDKETAMREKTARALRQGL